MNVQADSPRDPLDAWLAYASTSEIDTLSRADRNAPIPASHAQRGMWFAQQVAEADDCSLTIHQVYRLDGLLHVEALTRAFDVLVERHEVLRTGFAMGGLDLVQVIGAPGESLVEVVQVSAGSHLDQQVREFVGRPFDLDCGPLLRARLFCTGEQTHTLAVAFHHIAADGWSMGIFHVELAALYRAACGAGPDRSLHLAELAGLPELAIQYPDYAAWQRELAEDGEEYAESLALWQARLAGAPASTALPTDRPRSTLRTAAGGRVRSLIRPDDVEAVTKVAASHGTTAFTVFFAAFQALLAARCDQYDLVTGVTVANRQLPETEPLIGFLVNVLPVRTRHTPTTAFADFLRTCVERLREAYDHSEVPLELVLEKLDLPRTPGLKPLIQVTVAALQDSADLHLDGLSVEHVPPDRRHVHDDLTLYVGTTPEGGVVELDYQSCLFDHETVVALSQAYVRLLVAACANVDQPLDVLAEAAGIGHAL
ncbi:condensation domain-containing protein [Streptomyces sp. NPDC006530]|uniref:condensation domain-containing protein n=1 Tax=Streptomyces sp. NPDC006530 TaxID=3364750 RepID=UPI00369F52C7